MFADIIIFMKYEMRAYRDRWQAVAEIERQELQDATLDERWQQLNAVVSLAIGLGIMMPDQSEDKVHLQWAKLKNQSNNLYAAV